jgi:squalene-hopene/tetraprenyl-beta-curcumene cyclase
MSFPGGPDRLEHAYQIALARLLAERTSEGYWVGELSTSALSTATAVSALSLVRKATSTTEPFDTLIHDGLSWLATHQNADGGWGDTVKSFSNISTTMLARAAFHLAGAAAEHARVLTQADDYTRRHFGASPEQQAEAVRARYGKDRTFAVPILTTCALAGLVQWNEVPSLPFELACFPQSWFRFLRLRVVSYALPALIAIGQCVWHHRRPRNPIARFIRRLARRRSLRVLETIQPPNGGFLEATPLTSFVTLSLASIGLAEHPVARKGTDFIINSVRPDGSWPIDTNLSTWVTTLSINALAAAGELDRLDPLPELRDWLLRQQYLERHPYTGADPGGWAWTPLPGGVPDADDTPGALLALHHLTEQQRSPVDDFVHETIGPVKLEERAERCCPPPLDYSGQRGQVGFHVVCGLSWLRNLQNRNGGWPTFCRGWGHLPFDRSGTDLTAHAMRALGAWKGQLLASGVARAFVEAFTQTVRVDGVHVEFPSTSDIKSATDDGFAHLARSQRPDGSWLPLWFGNQHAPNDENPTYGTARVLAAYRDLNNMNSDPARRGVVWLLSVQNEDGGWGGAAHTPSSIEETALAVEVLLDARPEAEAAVNNGLRWLVQQIESGGLDQPTPIGFYFAKLWYFEKLYPIIFTVAALGKARHKLSDRQKTATEEPAPS